MGRWVGTIRGSERVLLWARLENEDADRATWVERSDFVLELGDGGSIHVDVSDESLVVEPIRERTGRFSSLADVPGADGFGERSPPPHDRVTLHHALVSGGDRVTVFGTVLEEAFDTEASHRTAPERRPARVGATRVVKGVASARVPAAKPPFSRAALFLIGLALALFALAAWGRAGGSDAVVAPAVALGLSLLAVAWVTQLRLNHPVQFIHQNELVGTRGAGPVFAAIPLSVIAVCGYALYDLAVTPEEGAALPALVFSGSLANVAWLWLFVLATTHTTVRLAKQILGAPPLDLARPGTFGRLVGVVHDPTPLDDGSAMKAERTESVSGAGDSDIISHHIESEQRRGFELRLADGASVPVRPERATWATTARRFGGHGPDQFRGSRRVRDSTVTPLSTERIPQGASLVVAGRLSKGGSMAATGPHPLLMFAAPPGGDALRALRALRRQPPLLLLGLTLVAAAIVAVTLAIAGELPDFSALGGE